METNKLPYEAPELDVIDIQVAGILMQSTEPGRNENVGYDDVNV